MTINEQVLAIINAYHSIGGYRYLDSHKYLEEINLDKLKTHSWLIDFLNKSSDIAVKSLVKKEHDIDSKLGVYNAPIFTKAGNSFGVHFLLKHYFYYYIVYLLKDDLQNFIENAKNSNIQHTKYNSESNSFIYWSYKYRETLKSLINSINQEAILEFIRFSPILMRPHNQSYLMDFNHLENLISNSKEDYNFEDLERYLNYYILNI